MFKEWKMNPIFSLPDFNVLSMFSSSILKYIQIINLALVLIQNVYLLFLQDFHTTLRYKKSSMQYAVTCSVGSVYDPPIKIPQETTLSISSEFPVSMGVTLLPSIIHGNEICFISTTKIFIKTLKACLVGLLAPSSS